MQISEETLWMNVYSAMQMEGVFWPGSATWPRVGKNCQMII
jgi:hypothetical protein